MRGHIASTGSPRSRCSLAMTRYAIPCHCERSEAIQSINLSQRDTYRIHCIATVAMLPRDDKEQITTTLSCHCEPSQMAWQSSNLCRRAATQHLHFEPRTLHFIKTGHVCPVFIQSIRVWWRQYLLCPLHCAITRRRGFQTIYIDVVRGVGRQIFS